MIKFLSENYGIILVLLLALSEFLSLFPKIKSNGIFQGIYDLIKKVNKILKKKQ